MNLKNTTLYTITAAVGILLLASLYVLSTYTEVYTRAESSEFLSNEKKAAQIITEKVISDGSDATIQNEINDLFYDIIIIKNDSLVAWNNLDRNIDQFYNNSNFILIKDKTEGEYRYLWGISIGVHRNQEIMVTSTNKRYNHITNNDSDLANDVIIKPQSNTKLLNLSIIGLWLIFILCCYEIATKRLLNSEWLISIGSTLFLVFSLVGTSYLSRDDMIYSYSVGDFNLVHWLLLSMYLYFHTRSMEEYIRSEKLNNITIIGIGSSIALMITGYAYLVREFILHTGLYNLETIAIQYSIGGIFYLGICLLSAYSIFYYCIVGLRLIFHSLLSTRDKYLYTFIGLAAVYIPAIFILELPMGSIFAFSVAYLLILELNLESRKKKIIFTLWWMLLFSGAIAVLNYYFILQKDINDRLKYTKNLYIESSKTQDRSIDSLDLILTESQVFQPIASLPVPAQLEKIDYQDFIMQFLDDINYDLGNKTLVTLGYDPTSKSIFKNQYTSFTELRRKLANSQRRKNKTYYNPYTSEYYLHYLIENDDYNRPIDLFFTISDDDQAKEREVSTFNYFVFNDKNVILSSISSDDVVPLSKLYDINETKLEGEYSYVVTNPKEGIKIISYKKSSGLIKPISLFSFLLTFSGIIIFLITIINTYIPFLPKIMTVEIDNRSSLRNKIQLTIVMLIVFSFIIIGVVTTYYFRNVLEKNRIVADQKETKTILNNIRSTIDGAQNNTEAQFILENRLKEIANNHDTHISLYNRQGSLLGSSLSEIEYYRLSMDMVSTLSGNKTAEFNSESGKYTIIPLLNKEKDAYASLALSSTPQLTSRRSIIDFLSTILNVYVFLFLMASAMAIGISNSITRPLSILAEKLKKFKLGRTNEKLEWHSRDEIGDLIQDYNNLTQELQESADIIAKTQRDMAWREMAKQVAHEIKNPLTPMKLSIQYLQKKIANDPENAIPLMDRISITLVEQINNLNQIANEFSNFASMPTAENEKVILNEIVEAIHDLFRKREDIEIHLSVPIDNLYVYADRNHLVRILNNIVKNAIQAIPTDRHGKIHIKLYKEGKLAVVKVSDNGTGIPDHMKTKVFEPNFTTKSSGTGLGLAISANMLDSFNGKIYFETEENVGTEFYIEIPLMRLDDNFKEDNRVFL